MKQKIKEKFRAIIAPETRRKIRRYSIKGAWYCTLATLGIAFLTTILYLYCIIR